MTTTLEPQLVEAADPQAQDAIRAVGEAMARLGPGETGFLVGPGREPMALPRALYDVLVLAAQALSRGGAISVLPADRLLTTQEAADVLNVSRTYLVRLLDQGRIPFQRVGRHRRVALADLVAFDDVRRRERREHLRGLIELSERYGLYDKNDEAMRLLAAQRDRDRRGE